MLAMGAAQAAASFALWPPSQWCKPRDTKDKAITETLALLGEDKDDIRPLKK
jgi:hypothetical protein